MFYLVANPFCPYCYGNDRVLEKELPDLDDNDITILPMLLTPDMQEFDDKIYESYKKNFELETIPYLKTLNITLPKFFKQENVHPSRLVYISYYFLREFNVGLKFYHEVTRRFYQTDFNFSDVDMLSQIVSDLGISKKEYLDAIKNPIYEKEYLDNMDLVDEAQIETVPSYIINNEVYQGIKKGIAKLKSNL